MRRIITGASAVAVAAAVFAGGSVLLGSNGEDAGKPVEAPGTTVTTTSGQAPDTSAAPETTVSTTAETTLPIPQEPVSDNTPEERPTTTRPPATTTPPAPPSTQGPVNPGFPTANPVRISGAVDTGYMPTDPVTDALWELPAGSSRAWAMRYTPTGDVATDYNNIMGGVRSAGVSVRRDDLQFAGADMFSAEIVGRLNGWYISIDVLEWREITVRLIKLA